MLTSRIPIAVEKRLRRTLLIGLLLAAVTLTLYWPVQSFDFVNLDDDVYVTHNRHVQQGHFIWNECQKAVPHFIKTIEMRRDYAYPYGNLGVCAALRNDTEQALDFFRQAILLNSLFTKAMIDRGLHLMQLGRLEEDVEDFRQVLRINPDDEAAHVNLSSIFNRQNRLGEAEWHMTEALHVNRGSAEAHNNLGILRVGQGMVDERNLLFLEALGTGAGAPRRAKKLTNRLARKSQYDSVRR